MKTNKKLTLGLAASLIFILLPAFSFGAVTYFTDCAWEGAEFVCDVYADTDGDNLISGGVKISYDPSKLSNPIAEKNEGVWFFGTESGTKYSYMDPELDESAGTITYIVGKLDEDDPTAGVSGERVVIGTVTFERSASDDPCAGDDPAGYYGLDLELGRDGEYENFVSTDGDLMDNSAGKGTIIAAERGDANADCQVNAVDYVAIRNYINASTPNPPPYADCNADGTVNAVDYVCVRNKINS